MLPEYEKKIESYLSGGMSPNERKAFEGELSSNSALKKALLMRSLIGQEQLMGEKELMAQTQAIAHAHLIPPPGDVPVSLGFQFREFMFNYGKIAASLVVLAVISYFLWNKNTSAKPENVIKQHLVEPICLNQAALGKTETEIAFQASAAYCNQANNPNKAALELLEKECPTDFCLSKYYLAHLQLREKDYSSAVVNFEQCLQYFDTGVKPFIGNARESLLFNLALANYGKGESLKVIKQDLELILNSSPPESGIFQRTQALLKDLNLR